MGTYFGVGMPSPEGAGKQMALRKATGAGPAGIDVYLEAQANQPDNAVGRVLVSVAYQQLGTSYSDITAAVDIAAEFLFLVNTTALMRKVYVRTKAGSPDILFDGLDVQPGPHLYPLYGVEFIGGLEWKADAVGVYGAFKGYKELP
jgi:hypothetical protein